MPTQQARPERGEPILYNGEAGVYVRNGAGVVGPAATHLAVRAHSRYGSKLDTLADVAAHDDRISVNVVVHIRIFAETVNRADGPVVIVPKAWLDVAKTTSETVKTIEANGITYQSMKVGSDITGALRKMKREGWTRQHFDSTADDIPVRDAEALVRSSAGKLHISNGDRCACGNFDPENATETITEFNGATLLEDETLCKSARSRIKKLVNRQAGSMTAGARIYDPSE